MGQLYRRLTSFAGRWWRVQIKVERCALAVAQDQLYAWVMRPDSKTRTQAIMGWADGIRLCQQ